MAERKAFLLRIDRALLDDVQRWANDDLRSLNGQIEFLLRRALRDAGRARADDGESERRNTKYTETGETADGGESRWEKEDDQ
jgi:hypothetical protein